MTDRLLEMQGVTHRYGQRAALDDVDVAIAAGETCAIVGHNGSGKSTLLRVFAGLIVPTSGTATIRGARPGSLEARAAVSYLPDTPILYDDLSIREHLEFVARLHGVDEWERGADELAHRLGIADRLDELPMALSRGLRQRAAIAIGFVRPCAAVLIDEPFVGLDESGREALAELIAATAESGVAALIATHQLDALRHTSRVIALRNGAVVFDGPPHEMPRGALADDDLV